MKDTKELQVAVRTPGDQESVPFQAMDVADESQMFSDFKGMPSEMLDKWVYEFTSNGQKVLGLSWVGTKEASIWLSGKQRKGIRRISPSQCPEFTKWQDITIDGKQYVEFSVVFEDLVSHRKMAGIVTQAYKGIGKNGSYDIEPSFVLRMAESKAQRNAIQKLIPASSLALFIDYARKQGKTQTLIPDKAQMTLKPAEAKSISKELTDIEKLANLDKLPRPFGFRVACFPVKLTGGSAGWTRVAAIFDQ